MAMSKGTSHYNRQVWEDAEFPILCETCLGDNPYVRMMKDKYGSECKICQRPFTTFRWCPGQKMRYKKTEICQTCARAKNVCQTCLLDLIYGLPVQVRDSVLATKQDTPKSDINREYFNQVLDKQVKESDPSEAWGQYKAQPSSDILSKLARNSPYYKRNRAHICSFWVKGECKRGEECPFRHEKPTDPEDPLSDQNIKDRYFGCNDPVADKILKRVTELPKPVSPEDKTVTTIYVGNIGELITEKDLKDYFYQFGEIRNIVVLQKQNCAFITFVNRQGAENAINKCFQKVVIKGQRLVLRWGKSQGKKGTSTNEETVSLRPVPGLPPPDYFNLTSTVTTTTTTANQRTPSASTSINTNIHYPSQDPNQIGSYSYKFNH